LNKQKLQNKGTENAAFVELNIPSIFRLPSSEQVLAWAFLYLTVNEKAP